MVTKRPASLSNEPKRCYHIFCVKSKNGDEFYHSKIDHIIPLSYFRYDILYQKKIKPLPHVFLLFKLNLQHSLNSLIMLKGTSWNFQQSISGAFATEITG